jgi:putative redox protein
METVLDKNKELKVSVKLVNSKLNFLGFSGDNTPVSIDYIAPLGDDSGYTSLELLLLSLSSCFGSAILTFLRRMKKSIASCDIKATGFRNETHPTGFKKILLNIDISSTDIADEDILKVIQLAKETYCPVLSMLKGNVDIEIRYAIFNK